MKKNCFIKFLTLTMALSLTSCHLNLALRTSKQLRSPEKLKHSYNYNDLSDEKYIEFKNNVKSFATRFSEVFAKQNFQEGRNIACSPLSVELCLGLAIRSAEGETRKELLNLFNVDYETFNKYYKLLFNELIFESKDGLNKTIAQILLTNSIWIDNNVSLLDSGLDALRDDYYCYSYEVDFDGNNEKANKAIQQFINDKTNGLLNPKLKLDPSILFVLMNTIYLKDVWNEYGDNLSYAEDSYKFKNIDGSVSSKRLLSGSYFAGRTLKTEEYSAFKTFTNHDLGLYFIKPNDGQNVIDVMSKENIDFAIDGSNYVRKDDEKKEMYFTRCVFPEFKGDCDLDLKEMFAKNFNVITLFDDRCNFSNLSKSDVYCSDFRHISKLEVSKKGIEGAAVTYMAMKGTASYWGEEDYKNVYETFEVDKEFGYVLTYRNTVLFSGITTNID